VLPARATGDHSEFVERLARLDLDGADGAAIGSIGGIEILESADVDAAQAAERIEAERDRLRGEIERLERKLANQGFVDKAPADVVEAEREKLEGYRAELDAL
jgi:valyl-tRNA synthetase